MTENRERGYVPLTIGANHFQLRFDLNAMCVLQQTIQVEGLQELVNKLRQPAALVSDLTFMRAFMHASLASRHPTVTLAQLGEMIGVGDLPTVTDALVEVLNSGATFPADPDAETGGGEDDADPRKPEMAA